MTTHDAKLAVESLRKFFADAKATAETLEEWIADTALAYCELRSERARQQLEKLLRELKDTSSQIARIIVATKGKLDRADAAIEALERGY